MTRVLLLVASSRGGGATYLADLAHGLAARGIEVQVAMPADGGTVGRRDFEPLGIPFHQIDINEGFSTTTLRQLRDLLRGVELVHVIGARAALFGRLAALSLANRRPRLVYAIQGFALPFYAQPRRNILLGVERVLAPVVDRYIAVSHAEKAALVGAGVAAARASRSCGTGSTSPGSALRSPTGHAERARLGVPATCCLLTMVCRLYKPRDFTTLLAAVAEARRQAPHLHLLIVGDGPQRAEVEAQIAERNLGACGDTGRLADAPAGDLCCQRHLHADDVGVGRAAPQRVGGDGRWAADRGDARRRHPRDRAACQRFPGEPLRCRCVGGVAGDAGVRPRPAPPDGRGGPADRPGRIQCGADGDIHRFGI